MHATKSSPQSSPARSLPAPPEPRVVAGSGSQVPRWAQRGQGGLLLASPLQAKLAINQPGDPYEQEADRIADRVMRMSTSQPVFASAVPAIAEVQRKCDGCGSLEDEELAPADPRLQRKAVTSQLQWQGTQDGYPTKETARNDNTLSPTVERHITNLSGGDPLAPSLRDFFEPRFGYDFGHVRVHTNSSATQSAQDIDAMAYTIGHRIVFNRGQFAPHTEPGLRLLAHELTHVVQQNPSIGRSSRTIPGAESAQLTDSAHAAAHLVATEPTVVQRKPFFLAPVARPSGTRVHSQVLPIFLAENSDLFIEAPIPGATKEDTDKQAVGRADFYKAEPQRTIGIKFDGDEPTSLRGGQVEWGGGKYSHGTQSAPQGSSTSPKVRKIKEAPTSIQIGDLKPGFSSETFLGEGQINNYRTGIRNTAAALNTYVSNNPGESDSKSTWTPMPTALMSLTIPSKITYPNGSAFPSVPLALHEEAFGRVRMVLENTSLKGRLFVYKDRVPGVWSYEWIPESIPAATGSGLVNTVLDRLNSDVIPSISAASGGGSTIQKKRLPQEVAAVRQRAIRPVVQKAPKTFDNAKWQKAHFDPWREQAEQFLADKKEVEKATVAQALVHVEERSQLNIGMPTEVKQRGRGLDKIKHWKRFGGLYGWLRDKFDFIYVKLKGFADKIKAKMKKLAKSSAAVKFGNWVKAAARVIFKIFKLVGSWVVRETVDQLLSSFKEGVSNNIKKLVESFTPEGVKSKIEEFEAFKAHYEKVVKEKEEELEKLLFGDKLDLFEKLQEFEEEAEKYGTIVSLVEWGVRLLACASPPAIGCLWNLAISALQAAFAMLIQTCWFTKKVYAPIISKVDLVRTFPATLASGVVAFANEYIPVPAGFDPLFAPINVNMSEFTVDCGAAGDSGSPVSPEREAILDLIDEIGQDKFNALLEMMLKRGAGPWVLLTSDRVAALKGLLKNVSSQDLRALAEDPSKSPPVSLEDLLADIGQYTAREKKVAKKFFEDKAVREAAKAAARGGGKEADGAGEESKPGGGQGEGDKDGITVLQGKDHAIKGPVGTTKPASTVTARVHDGTWQHAKEKPDIVSVDIFVDGAQKYRVENVRVSGVFGSEILAIPTNYYQIVYYLQDGLQINIDGTDYYWKQLVWAKFKEETR